MLPQAPAGWETPSVRVLISTTANDGHYGPLVPLARAFASTGHAVRVAAPASFASAVERSGFAHLPFDDAPAQLIGPVMARLPTLSFDEANATVMREVFGRIDAQAALPALVAAMDEWRPDVLVRDPAEFGSLAAAERAGVPHVHGAIGMAEMSRLIEGSTAEPLTELARLAGLPEESLTGALASEPILSPVPAVLDRAGDDEYDEASVAFRYREDSSAEPGAALPQWGDPDLPLVYVTFGSVTGSLAPFAGVFRQALEGLADLPVRVFMTVGRRVDLAGLRPIPTNAHVEAWWPQADVLAHADLLLGHGGFGTTMGAITAGVPQVVTPIFTSDQVINARHVAAAGAGRAVDPGPEVVSTACAEVLGVLSEPAFRAASQSLAAAIAELPPAAAAAAMVRRLAE
jgi:UDP:flavonoid glycosyltransferase YjiC (YdhE family)